MTKHSSAISLGLAAALLSGCYLSHGRVDDAALRPGTRDAGIARRDAGASTDASTDAGVALPPEPDPDLGSESRPSDYPDADEWEAPPDLGEDDPCCVMSDPVLLTSRDEGMALLHHPPYIAYGHGVWGLAATRQFLRSDPELGFRVVLWQLAADGVPVAEPRDVAPTPGSSEDAPTTVRALRWQEGRWALVASGAAPPAGGTTREMHAQLFDHELRPATSWLPLGLAKGVDVARLTSGDRWLGISVTEDALRVTPFSDLGLDRAAERPVPGWAALRAAGLRSRAAVLVSHPDRRRSAAEIRVIGAGPAYESLGRVPLATRHMDGAALTGLRDLVVAVTETGGRVEAEVVDPFALAHVAGPRIIGDIGASDSLSARYLDVVGLDKYDLAGVCYGVSAAPPGERGESRIEFRLIGSDGAPRGRAVTVVAGEFRGSSVGCSVGADELGFLVGWWTGSELWVRRVDVAR